MSFFQLSEDSWEQIASYLTAPDLLAYLSTCRALRDNLEREDSFWVRLLGHHFGVAAQSKIACHTKLTPKKAFLVQAHAKQLPLVRWHQLQMRRHWPSQREGHLCVRLGDLIVLTGGFSDDDSIFVKHVDQGYDWATITPVILNTTSTFTGDYSIETATGQPELPSFAYGASLTALDDSRAVRFGGFHSGGYSGEIAQVVLLRIDRENRLATWQVQPCRLRSGDVAHGAWKNYCARAYHTATLIYNRYLLVLGGMQSNSSIWRPILLDTLTWTWLDDRDVNGLLRAEATAALPSARHGHSVIWDQFRRRVVLFGGGSGSDLLRSGFDNSEVWQCPISSPTEFANAFRGDTFVELRTRWTCIHVDQHGTNVVDAGAATVTGMHPNQLSPVEALNLGRCHASFRVSRDTCLLVFGSGRPSTNGVLGYRLDTDSFVRVEVKGPLPRPRFTFAAVYIEEHAYLFVHGGFSSTAQCRSTLADGAILDLATSLQRPMHLFRTDHNAPSHPVEAHEGVLSSLSSFLASQARSRRNERLVTHIPTLRSLLVNRLLQAEAQSIGESDDSDDDILF